jgi:signal transduction histidine kinase
LTRLINDVLDLTKIESGKLSWRIEQLAIQDIIETSVSGIRSLVDNKGLTTTMRIQGPLPLIFGDRDRLIQVLNNLLSNAIKFTPQGGKIEVSARSEERPYPHIVIAVSDTGMGIRSEDLERIFEKFHRSSDILAEHAEGAGLGLTISRQIVEYHGGAIQAESKLGAGSTFTVTLPLNKSWNREGQEDSLQNIDLFEGAQ